MIANQKVEIQFLQKGRSPQEGQGIFLPARPSEEMIADSLQGY